LLPACKDADPDTGIPFKVDAIIANPPAYGQYILFTLDFFSYDVCYLPKNLQLKGKSLLLHNLMLYFLAKRKISVFGTYSFKSLLG
jgi:hypothetical protein